MFKHVAKILFAFIFIIPNASCDKKNCDNVVCPTMEDCYNGACLCINGYEGATCETISYQKYLGSYLVYEDYCTSQCTNFNEYNVTIFAAYAPTDTAHINYVEITPLFGLGPALAYIVNTAPNNLGNTIIIPNQVVAGSVTVSGQGNFYPANGTQKAYININFTYSYNGCDGPGNYSCTHTFYKQ